MATLLNLVNITNIALSFHLVARIFVSATSARGAYFVFSNSEPFLLNVSNIGLLCKYVLPFVCCLPLKDH